MATEIVKWEATLKIRAQSPGGTTDQQVLIIPDIGGATKVASADFPQVVARAVEKALLVFGTDEETKAAQTRADELDGRLTAALGEIKALKEAQRAKKEAIKAKIKKIGEARPLPKAKQPSED